MNTSIKNVILGFGIALISVIPASANTLVFSITAAQIYSGAINTTTGVSSSVGTNCGGSAAIGGGAAGLPFCGIYGIYLSTGTITNAAGSVVSGVAGPALAAGGGSVSAVAGALWGVTASDYWIQDGSTRQGTAANQAYGIEGNNFVGNTIAYVASTATGAGTIANGLAASAGTQIYSTDANGGASNTLKAASVGTAGDGITTVGSGGSGDIGILNATTTFTFYVTFPSTILASTTANLTLEVLLARINPTTGAQQAKTYDSTLLISGVNGTVVPEPSSILLALGALSALAAKYGRRS